MNFSNGWIWTAAVRGTCPATGFSSNIFFNEEKVYLSEIHEYLNHKAVDFELQKKGWKLPSQMRIVRAELWNSDYLRKVEFILYQLYDDDFFK